MGGDFNIDMISHNTVGAGYNIELRLYRDDVNALVTLPSSVNIGIYQVGTNNLVSQVTLHLGSSKLLPLGEPCYNPDTSILRVEMGLYDNYNIAFLPNYEPGYYFHYEVCCRNTVVSNIANPDSTGISILAIIPDPAIGQNSSPKFGSYPIDAYFCIANTKYFSWPVTDPDGDSLVFSLVTPLDDGTNPNNGNSAPGNNPYPYYPACNYAPGYSQNNPIGGSPAMSINPLTGEISASPDIFGTFAFTVRVEEFRNGVKIGEVRRDAQYKSEPCSSSKPPRLEIANNLGTFNANIQSLPCQHIFHMYDSYGDGWNFTSVDVMVNSDTVLSAATILSSSSTPNKSYLGLSFSAYSGDTIKLTNWITGFYTHEISWMITNGLGQVISDGFYPSSPIGWVSPSLTFVVGQAKCLDSENFSFDIISDDSLCIDMEITVDDPSDSLFAKLTSQNINLPIAYVQPDNVIQGSFTITTLSYLNWNNVKGNTVNFNPYTFKNGFIGSTGSLYLRYCWEDICMPLDTSLNIQVESYSYDCTGLEPTTNTITINCIPSTDFKLENKNDILIYPNPTKDIIFVDLENFKANIKIELFDLLGNKLISTSSQKISLKNYPKGVYILKVLKDKKIQKVKIIKE